MKINIPEALKSEMPQTLWGKVLAATPVVMTVIATMLAGLASSEMTRAQYARSLAAQQQSKAGDQWGFFQAKRLRGALQRNSLELLQNTTEVRPLQAADLQNLRPASDAPAGPAALAALQKTELPPLPAAAPLDPRIQDALRAIADLKPEAELAPFLAVLDEKTVTQAVYAARDRARGFDDATQPINDLIDQWDRQLAQQAGTGASAPLRALRRDFASARLGYMAARYDTEARLNQSLAHLFELQVRQSNLTAERHHRRSQRFFFGMLAAQAAVIISTFSLAARQRSLLWMIAAAAGLAAVAFAIYVYLYV